MKSTMLQFTLACVEKVGSVTSGSVGSRLGNHFWDPIVLRVLSTELAILIVPSAVPSLLMIQFDELIGLLGNAICNNQYLFSLADNQQPCN